ncbi:MAG: sodium:solute symporter, partial [Pedobacter sp.]
VRPWGFWKPIQDMVVKDDPTFQANKNFKLDMFNVALGIVAQLCLTIFPMYLITGMFSPLWITVGILTVIIFILKRTWWNRLED